MQRKVIQHAQDDMKSLAPEPIPRESPSDGRPSFWAELKAMAREAVKDIRAVVVEQGWFGQREGHGEPGTPLNPTQQMVTQDMGNVYGMEEKPSYQDLIRESAERGGRDQERGMDR